MSLLDKARANQEAMKEQEVAVNPTADISVIWQQIQRNNEMNQKLVTELGKAGNQKIIEAENAQLRKVLANVEQNFENYGKMLIDGMEKAKLQQDRFEKQHIEKYQILLDSNAIVEKAMSQEAQKLLGHSRKIVEDFGGKVQTGAETALNNLKNNLEVVNQQQRQTVELAKNAYIIQGYATVGVWIWRWVMFMMVMKLCQYAMGIDGFFSWLKVWSGIAIF